MVYRGTASPNIITLLEVRTIISIFMDNYTSTMTMHQELQLPLLTQRRQIHLAMECFSGVHNQESGLHCMFQHMDNNRLRDTRSSNKHKVKVENIRTTTGRKAFGFRGPNFWNKIDDDSRQIEEKGAFKNHISKLICRDVNHPG